MANTDLIELLKPILTNERLEPRDHITLANMIIKLETGGSPTLIVDNEEATPVPQKPSKKRRTQVRISGPRGWLSRVVMMGQGDLEVYRERGRAIGVRLPFDDTAADDHIVKLFQKSQNTYRIYPDGTWGFLRPRTGTDDM